MTERPGEGLDHQLAPLSLVLENSPVILYGLDREGRFLFSEGDGIAALGMTKGQILGNSAFELYHNTPEAAGAIGRALAGQHAVFRAHFGGAHFVSRLTPVFDDTGAVEQVVGVSVDITEQVRAEEELSRRDSELRQSQKMEAVGLLAGGMAHDFNNLLTVIIGSTDMALTQVNTDCPARQEIESARTAAEHGAALTRQILAFSRRQVLNPRVLSLNDVLQSIRPLIERTMGEDIQLNFRLDPQLGATEIDPSQLEQVLVNLEVNARDAMPAGGSLTIETANVDLDEEYCAQHVDAQPGPHVMLAVSDTGCGMDKETLSHLFEPFFTTKQPGKGTGLGLPTAYGIVKQSGGNIWVYSEPGQGTTIKIFLPRTDKPKEDLVPTKEEATSAVVKGETVLVVEDEPAVQALVSRALTRQGYRVLTASTADQALLAAEASEGAIDLLLSDVVLPGQDGAHVALRLRDMLPNLRVLFMSGYTKDAIVHDGRLDEGVNFIEKPFTPDALCRAVREVLDAD
jgi:PAS domain S-box-containing protein